ncbi:TetR/AcrR family transcriptional regulator [Cohnella abietis]|uniref:Putative HTH-type transcriptional regulator YezE n=1 Tax=Cohnella abietis TaxID=2507935 RepID=A0A3T1D635_9BACL|nr:TetR/AcrR family transcriptional regulator [Cohnella abietis]BBI33529.1 putative HTH-type transcriptional regulator YezE [Cohnella abietis]
MARPREFDQNEVLEKATELFWVKGYERTSIADLVSHTKVHRGSLYDTFGDKYQLFLACLGRVQQINYEFVFNILSGPDDPKKILRLFFEKTIDRALNENDKGLKGCFMTNIAMDMTVLDPNVASHVEAFNSKLESIFHNLLQQLQHNGNLASKYTVSELARFLVNTRHGLYITAKTTTDRQVLQSICNVALSFLD